ncbi:MAG TPA: hypothetical protein VN690_08850, partial [Terriglobales bacterium]|nr:hypothetical protein [Terriglobales bacterium]
MSTVTADLKPAAAESPTDPRLVMLWSQYRAARHGLRQARADGRRFRADLRESGPKIGLYLAEQHSRLARAGRSGQFDPWLRSHHIPHSTAYALIRRSSAKPLIPRKINCPQDNSQGLTLSGQTLTLKLSFRQTWLLRETLPRLMHPNTPAFNAADDL